VPDQGCRNGTGRDGAGTVSRRPAGKGRRLGAGLPQSVGDAGEFMPQDAKGWGRERLPEAAAAPTRTQVLIVKKFIKNICLYNAGLL
jgi:hypothetical protein